ncbi:hypothetical protein GCM10027028_07100 [Streptomyces sundarbansensis]
MAHRRGTGRPSSGSVEHRSAVLRGWTPYSPSLAGAQALPSVTESLYAVPASGGCVDMRPADATAYWNLLRSCDDVYGCEPTSERGAERIRRGAGRRGAGATVRYPRTPPVFVSAPGCQWPAVASDVPEEMP